LELFGVAALGKIFGMSSDCNMPEVKLSALVAEKHHDTRKGEAIRYS